MAGTQWGTGHWRREPGIFSPCAMARGSRKSVHITLRCAAKIKTGNIIVTRTPGRPATATAIDLGLIKPDRALRNAMSPPTTEVGRMLCTPGYTSRRRRPDSAAPGTFPATARRGAPTRTAAYRRALAGRTLEVQACARVAAGGLDELTVVVHVETSGRVSARIAGEPETLPSRCVDKALRHTPIAAPSAPVTFKHTFPLRPTPRQP